MLRCQDEPAPKSPQRAKPPCQLRQSLDTGERCGQNHRSLGRPSFEEFCAVCRDLIVDMQAAQNLNIPIDRLSNSYRALFPLSSILNEDNRNVAFVNDCCFWNNKRLMRATFDMNRR